MRTACLSSILALAVVGAAAAQLPAVVRGNGIPAAYIETTPGILGGNLAVGYGSPGTPNGIAVVSISGGFTPFVFPFPELAGALAIDPLDPSYQFFFFGLDAGGNGTVSVPLSPTFLPPSAPPLFADTVTFDSAAQWSVSKTTRIDWMLPNAWEAATPMAAVRQLHSATALGAGPRDNETDVLICGGATGSFIVPQPIASAELYSPLLRATSPLPNMSLPRSLHRAVRLRDGRVLIAGGATTLGVVTSTCEFFDPVTRTFALGPSMNAPRSGHAMTLLDDGRVLVTGGVSDWQNAATSFVAALNTAQETAEIFDPVANTWTPLPNMVSRRLGHSQVKLQDGRVLVISGIAGGYNGQLGGGQVPFYTTTCELFDPVTATFAGTAPLVLSGAVPPFNLPITRNGTAFGGATLLPNGSVRVAGGWSAIPASTASNDASEPHQLTAVWNAGVWTNGPTMPTSCAFHTQVQLGAATLVIGGVTNSASLTPSTAVYRVDAAITTLAPLSTARGMHSATVLHDGTVLVYGGGAWPATLDSGEIYALQ